jgi:hypothetical protein
VPLYAIAAFGASALAGKHQREPLLRPSDPFLIVPAFSERSAARLAHQSGGLGVPSSNLGAPTNATRIALIRRIYLQFHSI